MYLYIKKAFDRRYGQYEKVVEAFNDFSVPLFPLIHAFSFGWYQRD